MQDTTLVYRVLEREPKLADRATDQLQRLIVTRTFPPEHRLPSERELGDLLGVSRTVVREALRALTAKGLVEVRGGAGTFVTVPSTSLVSELLSLCLSHTDTGDVNFGHLLEIRRVLEIEMSGLAAERRDESDLAHLRELLESMNRQGTEAEEWARVDVGFHNALALASKNPLFPIVLRSITDILMYVRLLAIRLPETPRNALLHHTRIFEAVEKGDPAEARIAMGNHLRESEETIRRALTQNKSSVKP